MNNVDLINDIASFTHDPYSFVKYVYPWGKNEFVGIGSDRPRTWQADILKTIGYHLQIPSTRFTPLCIAVSSGHGIGKSTLVSQIIHWGLSTCDDCKIVVTAETEPQLRTKTWPEVSKWFRAAINSDWFKVTATSVLSTSPGRERTWRADAIAWSENNTEAFAGLHNKGKRIILIFDEASAIAPKVWEVAEGALTDENTEILWLVFGNPTRNDGRFSECFGSRKHRWERRQIDSRDVEGVNKEQLQREVDDYGEDSDFVRVRIRGVFPRAGTNQFIDSESVEYCRTYRPPEGSYDQLPIIMAADIARFGEDENAVCVRQGRKVFDIIRWKGVDLMYTSDRICDIFRTIHPDILFIDGGGVGGGVVDRCMQLLPKNKVREINFGSKPHSETKYFNKRAEMYGLARDAIRSRIALPNDADLIRQLTTVQYGFSDKQQIQIEKKEDMKKRGLSSPDSADAFVMTYAEPVLKERTEEKPFLLNREPINLNYSLVG